VALQQVTTSFCVCVRVHARMCVCVCVTSCMCACFTDRQCRSNGVIKYELQNDSPLRVPKHASWTVDAGGMVLSSMSDKATTPYELLIQHTLWTVDTGGIEVPPEYELLRVGLPDLMAAGLRFKGLVEDSCHVPTNGVLGGCQGECHPPGVA